MTSNHYELSSRLLDSWENLADALQVPPLERARFKRGREPQELFEWLNNRGRMAELPSALLSIQREDLICLISSDSEAAQSRAAGDASTRRIAARAANVASSVLASAKSNRTRKSNKSEAIGRKDRSAKRKIRASEERPLTFEAPAPLTVFVSSRMRAGLDNERTLTATIIDGLGLARAWLWERDGLNGPCERELCLTAARTSDVLVLLLGDDISPIVKAEFEAAYSAHAHCVVLAKRTFQPSRHCLTFIRRLAKRTIIPINFQNESELRTYLTQRIHAYVISATRATRRRS
ncbi:hypothetical protein ACMHYB_48345 [Sorangium sp. So ce1128]